MDNPVNNSSKNYFYDKLFKYKLFKKFQKQYFKLTPESDSLYRRRNKLILFFISLIGYSITHKWVNDYKLLFKTRFNKYFTIQIIKLALLGTWIISLQLVLKYIYYLNKVYKSYQFGLENTLKYSIINDTNKFTKNKDSRKFYSYNNVFDIIDSTTIKKNQ